MFDDNDLGQSAGFCRKPLAEAMASATGGNSWGKMLALALGMSLTGTGQAAIFTVTDQGDSGSGTLRDAIQQANALPGLDTIQFSGTTGVISLTSGELYVDDPLNIVGPGSSSLTISANNNSRVFRAASADLEIQGLTVADGNAPSGAGILVDFGSLTLRDSTVTGNTSTLNGGGVSQFGFDSFLTVQNSTISGNSAVYSGGGIDLYGFGNALSVQNSTISGNSSSLGYGGGINLEGKYNSLAVSDSTISGNTSASNGAGVSVYQYTYLQPPNRAPVPNQPFSIYGSTVSGNTCNGCNGGGLYSSLTYQNMEVVNSTVSGNQAVVGGGIYTRGYMALYLEHSTVTGNNGYAEAGGVAVELNSRLVSDTSIMAGNLSPGIADLYTSNSVAELSWSLLGDTASTVFGYTDVIGNLLNVDPQLGPLQDNGGPTLTHLPAVTSPVIDAGNPADVAPPTYDQRGTGFPRFINTVDMGAVEANVSPPEVSLGLSGSPFSENGGSATVTATLSHAFTGDVTVILAFSGTAANGIDFSPSSSSIVIPAGSTSGSITLNGIDDSLDELDESIVVDIDNVTNGTESGGMQQVTATITDDDALPEVSLALGGLRAPFSENGGSTEVIASLNAVSGLSVTVDLAFSGSATNAVDYTPSSSQIIIPAGQTSGNIQLTGLDDLLVEGDETVTTSISNVVNASIAGGSQSVTEVILDDDVAPPPPPPPARPPREIPTLSGWALWLLSLLVPGLAGASIRRRRRE